MSHEQAGFQPGQPMLLIDGRDRHYLITVPQPGQKLKLRDESIQAEVLLQLHSGELFISPMVRRYLVLSPTLEQVIMNMPRAAQVIYPKDLALMMHWGDVVPGQTVIEVGCGHGALTMTLLRALGPTGRLISFDLRQDHLNRTKKNAALYLGEDCLQTWTPVEADAYGEEGFLGHKADRLFSDVPEPWDLLEAAAGALHPGGVWVAYIPSVTQMSNLIEALNGDMRFSLAQGFETLQRFWHVRPPSVRPTHSMKAHTGFLVTCRRRWRKEEQ